VSQAQGVILLHFSLPSTQLALLRIQAKNTVLASSKSTFNVCLRLSVDSKKIDVEVLARYFKLKIKFSLSKFLDRKAIGFLVTQRTVPVILYSICIRYGKYRMCRYLMRSVAIRVVYPESEFFHPKSRFKRIPDSDFLPSRNRMLNTAYAIVSGTGTWLVHMRDANTGRKSQSHRYCLVNRYR
jgi:hypothetical protein